jgi:hypothetical protein
MWICEHPIDHTATDTITDLLKVGLVCSNQDALTSRFFKEDWTYSRSFYGFDGAATVNNFSSENRMTSTACGGYFFSN